MAGTCPQQDTPADQLVSHHLLHEAAHAASVDLRLNLSTGATEHNLGHVRYRGHLEPGQESRRTIERFATAYGQYLLDPEALRRDDPQAAATIERLMAAARARFERRTGTTAGD